MAVATNFQQQQKTRPSVEVSSNVQRGMECASCLSVCLPICPFVLIALCFLNQFSLFSLSLSLLLILSTKVSIYFARTPHTNTSYALISNYAPEKQQQLKSGNKSGGGGGETTTETLNAGGGGESVTSTSSSNSCTQSVCHRFGCSRAPFVLSLFFSLHNLSQQRRKHQNSQ